MLAALELHEWFHPHDRRRIELPAVYRLKDAVEKLLQNRIIELGSIDPARTAILGIHWQNDIVSDKGAFGPIFAQRVRELGLVSRMAGVYSAARRAGMTIVHVNVAVNAGHREVIPNNALFRTSIAQNGFIKGTHGAAVCDELAPGPNDFVIEHSRISGFYGTDLQTILKSIEADTVIVTGVATNVAVDHTVRDAVQLGYNTVLLEDCCCSSDARFHEAALLTLGVLATHVWKASDLIDRCQKIAAT